MIWTWPFFGILFAFSLVSVLSLSRPHNKHRIKKRQIGVLARTGTLPHGKRSLELLESEFQVPVREGFGENKFGETLQLIIRDLDTAKTFEKVKLEGLAEKLIENRDVDPSLKNRIGRPEEKRWAETMGRSGYLIKPIQKVAHPLPDLLDLDDLIAATQSSAVSGCSNKKGEKNKNWRKREILTSRLGALRKSEVSKEVDGNNDLMKNQDRYMEWSPEFLHSSAPYENVELPVDKRFLGRIPQLGRTHQKVQSPSARRRPHFRLNWL